jgi:hypothetical protein
MATFPDMNISKYVRQWRYCFSLLSWQQQHAISYLEYVQVLGLLCACVHLKAHVRARETGKPHLCIPCGPCRLFLFLYPFLLCRLPLIKLLGLRPRYSLLSPAGEKKNILSRETQICVNSVCTRGASQHAANLVDSYACSRQDVACLYDPHKYV